jgi:hypothetical protein
MKARNLSYALKLGVATLLLGGCTVAQPFIAGSGAMSRNQTLAVKPYEERRRSWIDARASRWDLLYVSNTTGPTVNVYRYSSRKLVGVLTGFVQPYGECVDPKSDVYVTDYGSNKIFEFAHGGMHPIKIIDESPYKPSGCAVDPASGDLAVGNLKELPTAPGSLAIYRHARGVPKIYTDPLQGYASCAYDDRGNLLATDGADSSSFLGSGFAFLAEGTGTLVRIRMLGGSSEIGNFNDVHGIAWDGKYWVINGQAMDEISRESVVPHHQRFIGRLEGVTTIRGAYSQMGPLAIYNDHSSSQGTQVVGTVGYDYPEVFYWAYPSGGSPIAVITTGLDRPLGVAISLKSAN